MGVRAFAPMLVLLPTVLDAGPGESAITDSFPVGCEVGRLGPSPVLRHCIDTRTRSVAWPDCAPTPLVTARGRQPPRRSPERLLGSVTENLASPRDHQHGTSAQILAGVYSMEPRSHSHGRSSIAAKVASWRGR